MFFTSRKFWVDAIERTVSTAAQTLLALAGVAATELVTLDWPAILIASGLAGALALTKAFALGGLTDPYQPKRSLDA